MFKRISRWFYLAGKAITIKFVPKDRVKGVWKWIFKQPILLYKLGAGPLIGNQVLLLTTIGRKSGSERRTALGYTYKPEIDTYYLTAGWDGRTDWYRNLQANPQVNVRVGKRNFDCLSRSVSEEEAVRLLQEYVDTNPFASQLWPELTGEPFDPSEEGLRHAIPHFPMVALKEEK